MQKEIALVYIVAGLAKRFGGKIKALEFVGPQGETLIEYSLNQALQFGFKKIILVVGEYTEKAFKEKLKYNYKGIPVSYAFQAFDKSTRDKPWGTADAICALKGINSNFLLCNGDDVYDKESIRILFDHLSNYSSCATIGFKLGNVLPEKGTVNRAIFKSFNGNILGIKEELNIQKYEIQKRNLNPNSLCSMNIFGLTPESVELISEFVNNFKKTHEGDRKIEVILPNVLSNLIKDKKIKMKLYPNNSSIFGITYPGDESILREKLKSI